MVKDDQIILERNNDYWGEKAKLDRIILNPSLNLRLGSWRFSLAPWTLPMI